MDKTKIPSRAEVPEADKWDLTHLFASADKWGEDFAWIPSTYPRLTISAISPDGINCLKSVLETFRNRLLF